MSYVIKECYFYSVNNNRYMQRALQLAKNGLGNVSPNPMVGCVIVCNNAIIGEGWHQKFGQSHAEVNAINSVKQKQLLREATVYITLEPCSFYGKTPACSALLIKKNVKKVVVSSLDPNPKVSGNGIKALKNAGIEVELILFDKKSILLNKRFFVNQKFQRPFVILKWAETQDGFIARKNRNSKWISNEYSRQKVHKWRTEEDAILVGKNTAKYDNPLLTARTWEGANPIRIVLDKNLELDKNLHTFNNQALTYVYNLKKNKKTKKIIFIKIKARNFLKQVLEDLYTKNIGSIMVEGGSKVLLNFILLNLWDEARVFKSTQLFKEGVKSPTIEQTPRLMENIEGDQLFYTYNSKTINF